MRVTLLLLVACFGAVAFADTCIKGVKGAELGQPCDQDVYCRDSAKNQAFCLAGVCTPRVEVGADCMQNYTLGMSSNPCVYGSDCLGVTGSQKCVARAKQGMPCGYFSQNATHPNCLYGYCSFSSNTCSGATIGDACTNTTQCADNNLECMNNVCGGPDAGSNCTSTGGCGLRKFCDFATLKCLDLPSEGGNCTYINACQPSLTCAPVLSSTNRVCVRYFSQAAGSYVGGNSQLCESRRASNGYCTTATIPATCTSNSHCPVDHVCACDGTSMIAGTGNCVKNGCFDLSQAVLKCVQTQCGQTSFSTYFSTYTAQEGVCELTNCKDELTAYHDCAPAASIVASALLVAFAAFVGRLASL